MEIIDVIFNSTYTWSILIFCSSMKDKSKSRILESTSTQALPKPYPTNKWPIPQKHEKMVIRCGTNYVLISMQHKHNQTLFIKFPCISGSSETLQQRDNTRWNSFATVFGIFSPIWSTNIERLISLPKIRPSESDLAECRILQKHQLEPIFIDFP